MAKANPIRHRWICICCHEERFVATYRNPTGLCQACSNRKGKTLLQRFWEQVNKEYACTCHSWDERCWTWTGRCTPGGYGEFKNPQASKTAHRFIYQATHGLLPSTVFVLHTPPCILKHCVRHLYAGSAQQNMNDKMAMGHHYTPFSRENFPHGEAFPSAKLTIAQVIEIRYFYDKGIMTPKAIAASFKISPRQVVRIGRREAWKRLP